MPAEIKTLIYALLLGLSAGGLMYNAVGLCAEIAERVRERYVKK